MKTLRDERGGSAVCIVIIVLLALLFVGAGAFGVWAYGERTDYKTNVDAKIAAAVTENTKKVQAEDNKRFAEEIKQPLRQYVGPEQYGSVHISYPNRWSNYAVVSDSGSSLDLYFHPDYVTSVSSPSSTFALRVQITRSPMSQVLTQYAGFQKQGKLTVAPYELPRNKGVTGSRLDGQISPTKRGTVILLPLRDKTLKIWTESEDFLGDFNNIILPNASFSP